METVPPSIESAEAKGGLMQPQHVNIYLPAMDPLEAEQEPLPAKQKFPVFIDSVFRCFQYWLKY